MVHCLEGHRPVPPERVSFTFRACKRPSYSDGCALRPRLHRSATLHLHGRGVLLRRREPSDTAGSCL